MGWCRRVSASCPRRRASHGSRDVRVDASVPRLATRWGRSALLLPPLPALRPAAIDSAGMQRILLGLPIPYSSIGRASGC